MATAGAVAAQDPRGAAQPAIEARPLLAPSTKAAPAAVDGAVAAPSEPASWPRVLGALAVVIGLIFVVRFVIKRAASTVGLRGQLGAGGRAPSGVLEVLGRYPISRGHSLVLLRVDQRVLLLSQSSSGFSALANFDDPTDVASLLMKTRDDESESLSGRFKQMLSAFERDPSMGNASDQIDLTRRAPLISRRPVAQTAPTGVQRVATPREAQDAIRKRLATLRESAA
jgi:flagellar biogenesis protein FliO